MTKYHDDAGPMNAASTIPDRNDPNPDRQALAQTGLLVRERLDADPGVYRVPTDKADFYAIRDFLNPQECERMMALIDRVARPSSCYDHGHGPGYRTSFSGDVERTEPFVRMIERRIDDCLGLDPSFGESVQGQRYAPGQEFKDHYDWFWTGGDYWAAESKRGGQRCWTTMVYLNEVEEGGDTVFSQLNMSIPPQPGLLLAWNNALPDGALNTATIHAAKPVVHGTKYVITKWYRTRKWG